VEEDKQQFELSGTVNSTEDTAAQKEQSQRIEIVTSFSQKLYELVATFKGTIPENENDIKLILALNMLMEREFTQYAAMSLQGLEEVVKRFNDRTLLTNNNFSVGDTDVATENAVYVFLEPLDFSEEGSTELSHVEKIEMATREYDEEGTKYSLYLYLNSNSYNEHKAMEEDLANSLSKKYKVITHVPTNVHLRNEAEVIVDTKPNVIIDELLSSFLSVFGLTKYRRNKIYFDIAYDSTVDPIGQIDFLLLAYRNLSKLLLSPEQAETMAKEFTRLWLHRNPHLKFIHEEAEDFFNCPSIVRVAGLSPFWGYIDSRVINIKGFAIAPTEDEETKVDIDLIDSSSIFGFSDADEEELRTYLTWNTKNLRKDLIRWKSPEGQDYVIRVDELNKTLNLKGVNLGFKGKKMFEDKIENNFDNLVFLTPYYLAENYNNLLSSKLGSALNKYQLPERFSEYLKRKAYYKRHLVNEIGTRWFTPENGVLEKLLSDLGQTFHLDSILRHSISPLDGLGVENIVVSLEEIKCHTEEKLKA